MEISQNRNKIEIFQNRNKMLPKIDCAPDVAAVDKADVAVQAITT